MLPKQHLGRSESFKAAGSFVPGFGGFSRVNVPEEWSCGLSAPGGECKGEQARLSQPFSPTTAGQILCSPIQLFRCHVVEKGYVLDSRG